MDISQIISFATENLGTISLVGGGLIGAGPLSILIKSRAGKYKLGMALAAIGSVITPEKIGKSDKPRHNAITDITAGMHDFSIGKINPNYPGDEDEIQDNTKT